jgi:hypothetical protein
MNWHYYLFAYGQKYLVSLFKIGRKCPGHKFLGGADRDRQGRDGKRLRKRLKAGNWEAAAAIKSLRP